MIEFTNSRSRISRNIEFFPRIQIFSFRAISLRDALKIRSKSEATEFLKSHNLPPPKPPNDEFQDLWHRAYQIMEVCWTRDADSRPRMSVIFEAQWQFLNQREPEDMKNFQNFIENSRELPGPPIPFGTSGIFRFAFDAVLSSVSLVSDRVEGMTAC